MANRMKEDEKNEKIIRGLLKLPPNRRCINCNSLGPQYVCTNFWTFICTNCSGLHREFTHRVKSISMAKFTSQEVNSLQEGGNARAREIYFKEWDPERNSFPDSSNIDRLREFIRHVYVDRRFTGERSIDKPPRVKTGDREDYNENRREDAIRGGSRSPPYDDTYERPGSYERRYNERPGSGGSNDERKNRFGYEGRSPGYDQGDYRRSPGLDERRRDDKPGNGNQNQRFEDRRFPDGVSRSEGRSPNHQTDFDASSPPVVRPVRDILGSDVPPLRIGEPPKANGTKSLDNSAQVQSNASSSSRGSSVGNAVELKKANFESLIDFDADPQPPVAIAPVQSVPQRTASLPATSGDWASFDFPPQHNTTPVASNAGQLESELSQLSVPGFTPAVSNSPVLVAGGDPFPKSNNGGQWQTMHQHQVMPTSTPYSAPAVAALNNQNLSQSWGSTVAPGMQVPFKVPTVQSSQAATRPPHETNTGALPQPSVEVKPIGRKELPEDIFAALYPGGPTSGWRTGAPLGMGYGMQYPTSELRKMPTFPQPTASGNPFDLGNESGLRHAPTFPSMTSLQGALPNMNDPSALLHNSSFITPAQWVPPQLPSYTYPTSSTSPYMMQQYPMNMPQQAPSNFNPLGHPGFGSQGPVFSSSTMNQHAATGNSQMGPPNSFVPSVGGNPFG